MSGLRSGAACHQEAAAAFCKPTLVCLPQLPLSEMHPWAEAAAETAEFAEFHGKFWEMHDLLFKNQAILSETLLLDLAEDLDLSRSQLRNDLEAMTYRSRVRADFEAGIRSGVNGTPTLSSMIDGTTGLSIPIPWQMPSIRRSR